LGIFFSDRAENKSEPFFTGFFSQISTDEKLVNSGECFNDYSSGVAALSSTSGECETPDYLQGRFQSPTASPPLPFANYQTGTFSIYGGPTGGNQAVMQDFYTMDKQNQEYIARGSPRIIVFRLDRESTVIDTTLGEARGDEFYKKGVVVHGVYEYSPIVEQLMKFGIDADQDIIIKFNYTHLLERIGRPVMAGDIIAVYLTNYRLDPAQLAQDVRSKDYYVRQVQKFYRVNTALPTNLFLYQYMNIECNCGMSNLDLENFDVTNVIEMDDVPDDINNPDSGVNPVNLNY
jgi:hypothetical protein